MKSSREFCFSWQIKQPSYSIFVRSCGEFILVSPDREEIKTPPFGEIFWPVSGQCVFRLDGKNYTLRPGHVWYYPPGSCHDFFPKKEFHYCWLTIAGNDCGKIFEMLGIKPGINKAGSCPRQLFSMVGSDISSLNRRHVLNAIAGAIKILSMIAAGDISDNSKTEEKNNIFDISSYIENNCGDPELSVKQIAANLNIHRVSLSRLFHKKFGITISDHIVACRMKKASELLTETDFTISETAAQCGFFSAQYFSKVFAHKSGMSPTAFRRKFKKVQ